MIVLYILGGVAGTALLSFVAGLVLSAPSLLMASELRRPRRFPNTFSETEIPSAEPASPSSWRWWQIVLSVLWAPFAALLVLFVGPAFLAMILVSTCQTYRFYRYLAYRTLRRFKFAFAFPRSFLVGFRIFIARMKQPPPAIAS